MLGRVGWFAIRRRWWILALTVVFAAIAVWTGGGVADRVSPGGFDDLGSEAAKTSAVLARDFGIGDPNVTLLVKAKSGTVDDPAVREAGLLLARRMATRPRASDVVSYWSTPGATSLKSEDGSWALVIGRVDGGDEYVASAMRRLATASNGPNSPTVVSVGGTAQVSEDINQQIQADLPRAELISLPIVLVLLVFIFGGLVAASLPVLLGVLAIFGTFLVLVVLTSITDVSVYSINVTTMMGLGLAIDYSLFIMSRYREELHNGLDRDAAIVRAVETGGRTVVFSAVAVAISLAALAVFPLYFLQSSAYAGISVVVLAGVMSVTFLPALLAVLGPRIDSVRFLKRPPVESGSGVWASIARFVMRRPAAVALLTLTFLLFIGSPFLGVDFGRGDDRALPETAPARIVSDVIREKFPASDSYPLSVVATDIGDPASRSAEIESYAIALSGVRNVARVDAITGTYAGYRRVGEPPPTAERMQTATATLLNVVPSVDPLSNDGEQLVPVIRSVPAPFDVGVTGIAALTVDSNSAVKERLPLAIAGISLVMFVVLFLLTGSVVLPVKTILLSFFSLTATFGAMVWIFQEGHLGSIFGITPTEVTDSTNPLLMFCIVFGLSMDYAVFLLSRIKEEHDKGLPDEQAITVGLEKSGRVVTAAAVLISIVFLSFATSEVAFIKLIGTGLALAILLDATIIRGLLVPSFMRLLGDANWWAPSFLRPVHERFGFESNGENYEERKPSMTESEVVAAVK